MPVRFDLARLFHLFHVARVAQSATIVHTCHTRHAPQAAPGVIEVAYLPFSGRNMVLFRRPANPSATPSFSAPPPPHPRPPLIAATTTASNAAAASTLVGRHEGGGPSHASQEAREVTKPAAGETDETDETDEADETPRETAPSAGGLAVSSISLDSAAAAQSAFEARERLRVKTELPLEVRQQAVLDYDEAEYPFTAFVCEALGLAPRELAKLHETPAGRTCQHSPPRSGHDPWRRRWLTYITTNVEARARLDEFVGRFVSRRLRAALGDRWEHFIYQVPADSKPSPREMRERDA